MILMGQGTVAAVQAAGASFIATVTLALLIIALLR